MIRGAIRTVSIPCSAGASPGRGGRSAKSVLTAAALIAVGLNAGIASAADMPAQAPVYTKAPAPVSYNWTGCYLGGNVGGGRAHKENIDNFLVTPETLGTHTANGVVGGGQLGCDYQIGSFVFGVRGMADWADLKAQNTIPQNPAVAYSTKISSIASATGRIGYAFTPPALIYVQGGGAWVRDRHQQLVPQPTVFASETQTWSGWTIGGGLEYMFAPSWSVFAEYNYAGFGDQHTCFVPQSCPGIAAPGGITEKFNVQSALAGVNYRFNLGR
jgi:outer membrane immunogenic protein